MRTARNKDSQGLGRPDEGRAAMEQFIHRENLALFKKRPAETRDESERQAFLKLLAEEEAKDSPRPPGSKS